MKLFRYLLLAILCPSIALGDCAYIDFDANSNIIRAKIIDTTDGQGLTGLSSASSGLRIAVIANNASATTAYTVAGSTIEGITTLGTFAIPNPTKVRFKEVDATNHPGIYEFQFDDAIFSAASAKSLIISASGASNMQEMDCSIPLLDSLTTIWSSFVSQSSSSPINASGSGGSSTIRKW